MLSFCQIKSYFWYSDWSHFCKSFKGFRIKSKHNNVFSVEEKQYTRNFIATQKKYVMLTLHFPLHWLKTESDNLIQHTFIHTVESYHQQHKHELYIQLLCFSATLLNSSRGRTECLVQCIPKCAQLFDTWLLKFNF